MSKGEGLMDQEPVELMELFLLGHKCCLDS